MPSPETYIRQRARSLPILECHINDGWRKNGLANVFVARKHSNGNITLGLYLVDLKCLGVKDAHWFFNISMRKYQDLLSRFDKGGETGPIPYTLAHNIIYAGLAYAEELGFLPHKDFTSVAQYILEEDTEDIELIDIECGNNGKPLFVQGPSENFVKAQKIIAQLERKVGSGNYHYLIIDEDGNFEEPFSEEMEDEEDEEDEDSNS